MQQKSNFVPGYQRARSKLTIGCSVFITLMLLVYPAPYRSCFFLAVHVPCGQEALLHYEGELHLA